MNDNDTRLCGTCKIIKPLSEYRYQNKSKGTKGYECNACTKIRSKEWRNKNKEKVIEYRKQYSKTNKKIIKEYSLKNTYGITVEQHKQMFVSQNGRCAICNKQFIKSKDIHIDHNHITGQIRQLLCSHCNTAIGLLKEDTYILNNAIQYLQKWNN